MVLEILAVSSWCLSALMLPVVAILVWWRRHMDPTEVIQEGDWVVTDDWLRKEDET